MSIEPPTVPPAAPRTINVIGTGRVRVRPDLADLRLGVTITAGTVESARAESALAMSAVVAGLKGLGVGESDIQTAFVSLSPVYDYSTSPEPPRLTGYTLANAVSVTIREIDRVGEAIDGALAAGATSLDRVAFRVEDPTGAELEARTAAVADAGAKAATLASAAGVSIAGVATITETAGPMPFPVPQLEMARMAVADAATPVEAGMNEISVTVAVTYLIR